MLRAIDRFALSTDGAAPSTDLLFAQASIDRAAIDGSRCAIDLYGDSAYMASARHQQPFSSCKI